MLIKELEISNEQIDFQKQTVDISEYGIYVIKGKMARERLVS